MQAASHRGGSVPAEVRFDTRFLAHYTNRDRQQQPPRELSVDRAQLIDEVHEVVTTLLSEHRQQPDSLSRTLLDDETSAPSRCATARVVTPATGSNAPQTEQGADDTAPASR